MKKLISISMFVLAAVCSANAQVDFRHITFDEAKEAAAKENKLIFMDFYTEWCGPCRMMIRDVFPLQEVGEFMNPKFVCLKLDAEKEGKELAAKYKVKGFPTFIMTDANGNVLGQFMGGTDAKSFMTMVDMNVNPELSKDRIAERYAAGERNAEVVSIYATNLQNDKKDKEAEDVVAEYFSKLTNEQRMQRDNLFVYHLGVPSIDSERSHFLLDNFKKFNEDDQKLLLLIASGICRHELSFIFNGNRFRKNVFNPETYEYLRKNLVNLDMMQSLQSKFDFIDQRLVLSFDDMLTYTRNNWDKLNHGEKMEVMAGFGDFLGADNKEKSQKVIALIRDLLHDMDYRVINVAGRQIGQLEKVE